MKKTNVIVSAFGQIPKAYIKKLNILLAGLSAFVLGSIIFYNPTPLYDIITEKSVEGFGLTWPAIRFFIEPFYAFSYYMQTLERTFYGYAIVSWLAWLLIFSFGSSMLKKEPLKKAFVKALVFFLCFITLAVGILLLRIPGARLWAPEGKSIICIHSHTASSHDGIITPRTALRYFRAHGYDSFFITEHNHTEGFLRFPESARFDRVFPGMQMSARDGVSVLILSGTEFNGDKFRHMYLREIVARAHEYGMLAIMPHYWKWGHFSLEQLKDLGIDGFEVYNNGYRNISQERRRNLIEFCKNNDLMMFAVTDYHGWGFVTDAWTVVEGQTRGGKLFDVLKSRPQTWLVTNRGEQSASLIRFVFEPLAFLYYYLKEAPPKHVISFVLGIALLYLLSLFGFARKFVYVLPLVFSVGFAGLSIKYYFLWTGFRQTNCVILDTVVPVLFGLSLFWFLAWYFAYRKKI